MPTVPLWLANTMESVFSRQFKPATVTETDYIAPQLKRVRFAGEALQGVDFQAGQEIEFRVNETSYRHYTPSIWNAQQGYTDVLFYLHNQGPGSNWADALKVGDQTKVMGPGGGKLSLNKTALHHVFLGDETTLSLFLSLQEAMPKGHSFQGAIESESQHAGWLPAIGLAIDTVTRQKERGIAFLDWLAQQQFPKATQFYLSGHAKSIQLIRNYLVKSGQTSGQIKTRPYWADGKKGL